MPVLVKFQGNIIAHISTGQYSLRYPCENSSFCPPLIMTLSPGLYMFECWGADGGFIEPGRGGRGGYASGEVRLQDSEIIYVNIGGTGEFSDSFSGDGGNNGGGNGYVRLIPPTDHLLSLGGGGGTDIRIKVNDLYHRILVAGGGGSQGWWKDVNGNEFSGSGGCGGGVFGCDGGKDYNNHIGQGATQTSGGESMSKGFFGVGGDRGGGGGWYGGAGSRYGNGNGGGSGFVYNSSSNLPVGYEVDSSFMVLNSTLISGEEQHPHFCNNDEISHSPNGAFRITIVESSSRIGCCRSSCNILSHIYYYFQFLFFIFYHNSII